MRFSTHEIRKEEEGGCCEPLKIRAQNPSFIIAIKSGFPKQANPNLPLSQVTL